MKTVTVSPKFQVVIPREVRESLSIKPGEKMQVINHADRIEFVLIRKIKDMRGFLKELIQAWSARKTGHEPYRFLRRLEYLDLASSLDDLKVPPSNRLHALKERNPRRSSPGPARSHRTPTGACCSRSEWQGVQQDSAPRRAEKNDAALE
jgi:AbrB family looped-hinge helix DNA binding protein